MKLLRKKKMKLFTKDGIKIPVTKCKKPRFKCHRGRTWDFGTIIINGIEYDAHLDTSWGEYLYFQYEPNYQWYKFPMRAPYPIDFNGIGYYDVDPFSIKSEQLFTNIKDIK